jgi:hypothetical protein
MKSLTKEEIAEVNGAGIIPIVALVVSAIGVGIGALANADKIGAFIDGVADGYTGK